MRVSVNVDLHGTLTTTVSPDNEISIGFVALPATDVSWTQLDQQLFAIFQVRGVVTGKRRLFKN